MDTLAPVNKELWIKFSELSASNILENANNLGPKHAFSKEERELAYLLKKY